MKTIITSTLLASGLLLMGLNLSGPNTKLKPAKDEINVEDLIKTQRTYLSPPASPICPSAEYQLTALNRGMAEGQLSPIMTLHCAKCSLGALYKKDNDELYTCTYCETRQ